MAPKNRIIIDTDPGVDDVLAILLALAASPEDLEVVMISVTYGNVSLERCLRNAVALFHVVDKELEWRRANGKSEGFPGFKAYKPIISVGTEHPLEDEELAADYFHGADGLHNVHETHPELSPADTWKRLFGRGAESLPSDTADVGTYSKYFTPSTTPAHREMLRLLKENPEDTISIVAIGPLTNVALAAAEDPVAFLRVKELVVMGGAVHVPGNISPVGEFNCLADPVAAARVYALTSPFPASTMPPRSLERKSLPAYPTKLSKRLKLALFPLDITTPHLLMKSQFAKIIEPLVAAGSPLAQWTATFMLGTFATIESRREGEAGLSLHDPLCIWYMIAHDNPAWKGVPEPEDIRVETGGQWSRGMHLIDRRGRKAVKPAYDESKIGTMDGLKFDEIPWDTLEWSERQGNRINRIIESPGETIFGGYMMQMLFP